MQGQEAGTNLFCIYRDCEDLALFGDYCKAHQFQRAEAAEAECDELRRRLTEAQRAIDVLSNTVVAQDATIKRLNQAREDVAEYRAEIERLNQAATA